jgi:hypothetical protein
VAYNEVRRSKGYGIEPHDEKRASHVGNHNARIGDST